MNLKLLSKKYAIHLIAFIISIFIFFLATNFLLLAIEAGGCPPNETCPTGTKPVPIECCLGYCFKTVPNGYCILCAPLPK